MSNREKTEVTTEIALATTEVAGESSRTVDLDGIGRVHVRDRDMAARVSRSMAKQADKYFAAMKRASQVASGLIALDEIPDGDHKLDVTAILRRQGYISGPGEK